MLRFRIGPFSLASSILVLLLLSGLRLPRAVAQEVQYPIAVAVSPSGEVFVADRNLPGIWKIENDQAKVFFAAQRRIGSPLNAIRCLAFDSDGKLLAGDSAGRDVYRFVDGKPVPLTGGKISIPMGIAIDKAGDILVSDLTLQAIWKIPKAGGEPTKFAAVPAPTALAMDAEQTLWVVSRNKQSQLFRVTGGQVTAVIKGRPIGFPQDIVVAADKSVFISDGYGRSIWKLAAGAEQPQKHVEGAPLVYPVGLAWHDKTLLVIDPRSKSLIRVDQAGQATAVPLAKLTAAKQDATKQKEATKKEATKKEATEKEATKKEATEKEATKKDAAKK